MADCGTIEVVPGFDPAMVSIVGCNVLTAQIAPGEPAVEPIEVSIRNDNDVSAQYGIEALANGTVVASSELITQANETTTWFPTFDALSEGSYDIQVRLTTIRQREPTMAQPAPAQPRPRAVRAGAVRTSGCGCDSGSGGRGSGVFTGPGQPTLVNRLGFGR